MEGKSGVSGSPDTRYKFTGKERDTETGYDYFGARYYDARIGRWHTVDPLADRGVLRSWSSYHYSLCNPLLFVDPKGMAPDVYVKGKDGNRAANELDKETQVKISRDAKTGKLSATGEPGNKAEEILVKAINDPSVNVNLETTDANSFISKDGSEQNILVDTYDGSTRSNDNQTDTRQVMNMDHAGELERVGGPAAGLSVMHAINESYFGALQDPGGSYSSGFQKAHSAAAAIDPPSRKFKLGLNINSQKGQLEGFVKSVFGTSILWTKPLK